MARFARTIHIVTASLIAVVSATPSLAQTQQQLSACLHGDETFSPRLRIDGCTAVIQSNRYTNENLSLAFYNRGIAYFRMSEYDRAITDFDNALKLDPGSTFTLNNRGTAYARKVQYDRAIADFNEAIRVNPNHAVTFNNRGSALAKKGQYDRAIADFDKAIELDPNDQGALSNRKLAERLKGKSARAELDPAKTPKKRGTAEKEKMKLDPPESDAKSSGLAENRAREVQSNVAAPNPDSNVASELRLRTSEKQTKADPQQVGTNVAALTDERQMPPARETPAAENKSEIKAPPRPQQPTLAKTNSKTKVAAIHPRQPKGQTAVGRFFQRSQIKLQNALRAISQRRVF